MPTLKEGHLKDGSQEGLVTNNVPVQHIAGDTKGREKIVEAICTMGKVMVFAIFMITHGKISQP